MEYELGKKVRLLRGHTRFPAGSVGEITDINGYDDVQPIRVDFGRDGMGWPHVGTFELIEDEEPDVDLTKIDKPLGLLDEDTKQRLRDWPHGWEVYSARGWISRGEPQWDNFAAYRAKPAPERKSIWMNVYEENNFSLHQSETSARMFCGGRIAVWHIEYNEDGSDPKIFVEDV